MQYFLPHNNMSFGDVCHNILTISGGGCRGYQELFVLREIEREAKIEFGKKYLCESYDLVGGSSVGAINAALIATGKFTLEEIIAFYPKMIKSIFKKRSTLFKPFPLYDRENFRKAWMELIGPMKFGEVKTKLIITSVNRMTETTEYFKSWEDGKFHSVNDDLCDIVMRSFAAPLYFGQINDDVHQAIWTDGGMGYFNIPLELMKNEIEVNDWYEGKHHSMFHIIGAGFVDEGSQAKEYKKESKDRMLGQVFGGYLRPQNGGMARAGSADDQINMMRFVAKRKKNLHYRYYDIAIPAKFDKLDGSSDEDIMFYRRAGMSMAQKAYDEVI